MHVGTHKTGTTTLQSALRAHEDAFARASVLVARAGRPLAPNGTRDNANHNLAFELNGDARFVHGDGTLDDLSAELSASAHAKAIVSSEDFAFAFEHRTRLERLLDAVRAGGFEPAIIVYLREQAAYAQSLYAMFAADTADYAASFDDFTAYIFDETKFRYGFRDLPFDYDELLEPFATVFGRDNVYARAYRTDRGPDYLLRDFASIVDAPEPFDAQAFCKTPRLHEARTLRQLLDSLRLTYAAHHSALEPSVPAMAEAAGFDAQELESPFAALSPEATRRFRERSARSNGAILQNYGVAIEQSIPRDAALSARQNTFLNTCTAAWLAALTNDGRHRNDRDR